MASNGNLPVYTESTLLPGHHWRCCLKGHPLYRRTKDPKNATWIWIRYKLAINSLSITVPFLASSCPVSFRCHSYKDVCFATDLTSSLKCLHQQLPLTLAKENEYSLPWRKSRRMQVLFLGSHCFLCIGEAALQRALSLPSCYLCFP